MITNRAFSIVRSDVSGSTFYPRGTEDPNNGRGTCNVTEWCWAIIQCSELFLQTNFFLGKLTGKFASIDIIIEVASDN